MSYYRRAQIAHYVSTDVQFAIASLHAELCSRMRTRTGQNWAGQVGSHGKRQFLWQIGMSGKGLTMTTLENRRTSSPDPMRNMSAYSAFMFLSYTLDRRETTPPTLPVTSSSDQLRSDQTNKSLLRSKRTNSDPLLLRGWTGNPSLPPSFRGSSGSEQTGNTASQLPLTSTKQPMHNVRSDKKQTPSTGIQKCRTAWITWANVLAQP